MCKCILFLNHFLSFISFPSWLPFPGTRDLFQVATMTDSHSRTTWEEILNTREITKAKFWDLLQTLEAVFLGCLKNPLRSWVLFLVEETHVLLRPSRQQRPRLPKLRKAPRKACSSFRRRECPHQVVVSSLAPGSNRESPRSLIPASWCARTDRPTSSSPFTESTGISTTAGSVWLQTGRCCEPLRCVNGMCVFLGKVSGTSDSEMVLWLTPGNSARDRLLSFLSQSLL